VESVAALVLATVGPGAASVDAALRLDGSLSGWVGVGIGLGGIVAGLGQLTIFWQRPGREEPTAHQPGLPAEPVPPPVSSLRP
jgi:hypothetical protein